MPRRQLHLNVNLLHSGVYPSAWRLPDSDPRACFDLGHYVRVAQIAERGKVRRDLSGGFAGRERSHRLPVIHVAGTDHRAGDGRGRDEAHVGLIGTVSTTYNEPYNIARRFVTLDHASGGRTGWNAVTTADAASSAQFWPLSGALEHKARYERAKEFTEVVHALFDSWEDEAFVGDKASATICRYVEGASDRASRPALLGGRTSERAALTTRTARHGPGRRVE